MAVDQHSDELRNVQENDHVTIETSDGTQLTGECISRETTRASHKSGEIRQSEIWRFSTDQGTVTFSILDGLKSSPNDPDFPVHKDGWHLDKEESVGYVSEIKHNA